MSIGGMLGGITGMVGLAAGVGDVSAGQRNPRSELQNNLEALLSVAPGQLSAEQQYDPQYADLQNQVLRRSLLGDSGVLNTLTQMQPAVNTINTATRQGTIDDFKNLGPGMMAAWRQSNPDVAKLLDQINAMTSTGLTAGSTLDPDLARTLAQSYRGGQSARGLGTGRGDAGMEAYYMAQQGNNMRQQRLSNASNAVSLNTATTPNMLSWLMNSGGVTAPQMLGAGSQYVSGAGPKLFDPMNSYLQDVNNTNFNASEAANISSANNEAAILGGMMGSARGSSGGGASAMGMC